MTYPTKHLVEICSVKTGKRDANHGDSGGPYPFFTCADKPIKSPTYTFDGESIILPGNGANVGLVLYYSGKIEAYQRTYVLNEFKCDPRYVFHHLKCYWSAVNRFNQFGSATNYIRMGNFENYKIPLPPIAQQKRIAAILDKAEELRSLRRQALRELDAIAQSIFLQMFGNPEADPKHPIGTIRPFVEASSGKSAKKVLSSEPTEIPVYGGNGINGWAVQSLYNEPVLVVGRVGQQCGKTYVTDKPSWVTDNAIAIKITNKKILNLTYLLYVFSMVHISETVKHLDLPFINQQIVLDFSLPIPPFSLQQEFAQRVEAIEQLKTTHRESLTYLDALFASLQHRAFRGEL